MQQHIMRGKVDLDDSSSCIMGGVAQVYEIHEKEYVSFTYLFFFFLSPSLNCQTRKL